MNQSTVAGTAGAAAHASRPDYAALAVAAGGHRCTADGVVVHVGKHPSTDFDALPSRSILRPALHLGAWVVSASDQSWRAGRLLADLVVGTRLNDLRLHLSTRLRRDDGSEDGAGEVHAMQLELASELLAPFYGSVIARDREGRLLRGFEIKTIAEVPAEQVHWQATALASAGFRNIFATALASLYQHGQHTFSTLLPTAYQDAALEVSWARYLRRSLHLVDSQPINETAAVEVMNVLDGPRTEFSYTPQGSKGRPETLKLCLASERHVVLPPNARFPSHFASFRDGQGPPSQRMSAAPGFQVREAGYRTRSPSRELPPPFRALAFHFVAEAWLSDGCVLLADVRWHGNYARTAPGYPVHDCLEINISQQTPTSTTTDLAVASIMLLRSIEMRPCWVHAFRAGPGPHPESAAVPLVLGALPSLLNVPGHLASAHLVEELRQHGYSERHMQDNVYSFERFGSWGLHITSTLHADPVIIEELLPYCYPNFDLPNGLGTLQPPAAEHLYHLDKTGESFLASSLTYPSGEAGRPRWSAAHYS